MPIPYSLDLWWRIICVALTWHASPQDIAQQLSVSEWTVRRYLKMLEGTDDVKPHSRRSGPLHLFGEYKQLTLLRLTNHGIYLHEIQQQLFHMFGVDLSVSTICRIPKFMGCTPKKQVGYFNHGVVILVAANWRDRGWGRFTLVLETIIAQGNQRDSYPDHLTTLNYPACW